MRIAGVRGVTFHFYCRQQGGFTLIEALIAMFIFSWIGLASYQMLDQVMLAQQVNKGYSEGLSNRQRVNWQISRDFRHMINRPIIDELGDERGALDIDRDDYLVEFTRAGWTNPLKWPRSQLQRVAYRIDYHPDANEPDSPYYGDDASYLIRVYWPVLDRALTTEPQQQALLKNVVDMQLRFWNQLDKQWEESIQLNLMGGGAAGGGLAAYQKPYAIEVTLLLENDELWTAIYPLS
jgi:general secretion pathway protein J